MFLISRCESASQRPWSISALRGKPIRLFPKSNITHKPARAPWSSDYIPKANRSCTCVNLLQQVGSLYRVGTSIGNTKLQRWQGADTRHRGQIKPKRIATFDSLESAGLYWLPMSTKHWASNFLTVRPALLLNPTNNVKPLSINARLLDSISASANRVVVSECPLLISTSQQ